MKRREPSGLQTLAKAARDAVCHTAFSFEESYLPNFLGHIFDKLPGLNPTGRTSQIGISCVQRIFTPDDFNEINLIENDLPYSGQLVFNFTLSTQSKKHLDAHTLSIGVTGLRSGAEDLQTGLHFISDPHLQWAGIIN